MGYSILEVISSTPLAGVSRVVWWVNVSAKKYIS